MSALENVFTWSHSRDVCFRRCPRQYFFAYYAAWGGWERGAGARTRTAYVLKQLRGRKAWAGENVHAAIRHALAAVRDGGSLFSPDAIIDQTLQTMRAQWRDSGEGLYWHEPKKSCALWEHEYDIELPDATWKATVDHALACLRSFFASDLYRAIAALPREAWLELEELASFDLAGTKVWVQLDFAHREGDGIVIYDWKTGRAGRDETRAQLAGYILYATQRWGVAPDRIVAREFNLAANERHEMRLAADELEPLRKTIGAAAAELGSLHGAGEDAFPLAADETVCTSCNFLRICPRFIDDVGSGSPAPAAE